MTEHLHILNNYIDVMRRGEFHSVADAVETWERQAPEEFDPAWLGWAGIANYLAGRFQLAINNYLRAIANDKDNLQALNGLAYIHGCCPDETFHDPERGLRFANRSIAIYDKDWRSLLTRAALFLRTSNYDSARNDANQALRLAPDSYKWRCERILDICEKEGTFTASLEEDFEKFKTEIQQYETE